MSEADRPDMPSPDTHGYYEAFAASGWYDRDAESSGWPPALDALMRRTFEIKPAASVHSALDLGAGTGLTIAAIKNYARPERLVAVDASAKMLKLLGQKDVAAGVTRKTDTIQNYVAECEEKFDLITSFSALEFLPNLPVTLRDVARLLDEDGILAFTYVARDENDPPEELVDSSSSVIGATMLKYHWLSQEIEQGLTDSGLIVVDRLEDATPEVRGLDYNFVAAQKPAT